MSRSFKLGRKVWDEFEEKIQLLMNDEAAASDTPVDGDSDDEDDESVLDDGKYKLCKGETCLMITSVIYVCLATMDSVDRLRLFEDRLLHVDLFVDHPIWLVAFALACTGDEETENGTTLRKWAPYVDELSDIRGLSATYVINVLTSKHGFNAFMKESPIFDPQIVRQFRMTDWTVILNHDKVYDIINNYRCLSSSLKCHTTDHIRIINEFALLQ